MLWESMLLRLLLLVRCRQGKCTEGNIASGQEATLTCLRLASQAKARAAESAAAAAAAEDAAERCGDLERQASQLEARLRQARFAFACSCWKLWAACPASRGWNIQASYVLVYEKSATAGPAGGLRSLTVEWGLLNPTKTLQARAELAGAAAERERLSGALAAREVELAAAQARARESTTPADDESWLVSADFGDLA